MRPYSEKYSARPLVFFLVDAEGRGPWCFIGGCGSGDEGLVFHWDGKAKAKGMMMDDVSHTNLTGRDSHRLSQSLAQRIGIPTDFRSFQWLHPLVTLPRAPVATIHGSHGGEFRQIQVLSISDSSRMTQVVDLTIHRIWLGLHGNQKTKSGN